MRKSKIPVKVRKFLNRLHRRISAMPLSRRMVLLLLCMEALALVVAGSLMIGILHRQLIAQIDDQLRSSASQLSATITASTQTRTATAVVPSDYYVQSLFINSDGSFETGFVFLSEETLAKAGKPKLTEITSLDTCSSQTGMTCPETVGSSVDGASWRIAIVQISSDQDAVGLLIIGLPLVDATDTLYSTAYSFVLASISLLLSTGLLGFYLVRRSLRPLKTIEGVAGQIAGGDLSSRIPPAPPTTEVGSLSASLNTMLGQIEQSFAAQQASELRQRQFVADASHELRTPLAVISGYTQLYFSGGIPEDSYDDVMGRIQSESKRMTSLVQDLLTLARLDADRPLDIAEINLVELARNTQSDLHALDSDRQVSVCGLTGEHPPEEVLLQADRNQITQVFVNLAGNIARYTPSGSPVEIALGVVSAESLPPEILALQGASATKRGSVRTDNTEINDEDLSKNVSTNNDDSKTNDKNLSTKESISYTIVEFRDHGPGIPKNEQTKVFERFYRSDKSRSRAIGGSGLGLAIVSSIMAKHGGKVWMSTTDPQGLTVHLALPLK